jgi:hypothetical protein
VVEKGCTPTRNRVNVKFVSLFPYQDTSYEICVKSNARGFVPQILSPSISGKMINTGRCSTLPPGKIGDLPAYLVDFNGLRLPHFFFNVYRISEIHLLGSS